MSIPLKQSAVIQSPPVADLELDALSKAFGGASISSPIAKADINPYSVIKDAHQDDVHGLITLNATTFVSGSKDATLKIWDVTKKTFQIFDAHPSSRGYHSWITALAVVSADRFASGSRDGHILIRKHTGEVTQSILYNPDPTAKKGYVCKDRNKTRINCIAKAPSPEGHTHFYIGTPQYIQLFDADTAKLLRYRKASENDWVYCITPMDNDLVVAIGSTLEFWKKRDRDFDVSPIITPQRTTRPPLHKPHISSLISLDHDPHAMAATVFDGSVKLVNILTRTVTRSYNEHKGRVWNVVNLAPSILASGADDGLIKIWDVRTGPKSVLTSKPQSGRVSGLLVLNPTTLISAACPDDVFTSPDKAGLAFWDIRKLTPTP